MSEALAASNLTTFVVGSRGYRPLRAHDSDAAFDLCAAEHVWLRPGERAVVDTDVRVILPSECAGLVVPRSGLALKHGITVLNAPGLIDPGYRGNIGVILQNTDHELAYEVEPGERIAQLLVVRFDRSALWYQSSEVAVDTTARGVGGFGSTG